MAIFGTGSRSKPKSEEFLDFVICGAGRLSVDFFALHLDTSLSEVDGDSQTLLALFALFVSHGARVAEPD